MIGTKIGPYVLLRLLGSGGMGHVYLAEHVVLKDLHAVKILDAQLTQNPQIVTRFVNEARAAARLRHRNLIRVHHIDQAPNGAWYMVLDYLEGATLHHYMSASGGPIAPHDIVHILAQVANCIHHVHDHAVIHRDLKPDNIFLVEREGDPRVPVVLDLGVAQLNGELAGQATKTGTVIGTPIYMAPEQLRGERVTYAADLFALGVIAYEMATGGWFPYQHDGETRSSYVELPPTEIYFRQRSEPPADPRARCPGISDPLARAILRALDADPAKRPESALALALALAEAVPTDGVNPDGLAIVRQVARELTQSDTLGETIRATRPPVEIAGTSAGDSRYHIVEKLGAGGMAEVFLATQSGVEGFARKVAIKRVLAGYSEVPEFATMFVSEAQLACNLSHPNIVSVLDFDKDGEGRLFLVMEYVHGRDLAAVLEAGPLPPSLIIYIVTEVLRGLSYAHELSDPGGAVRGLVHRDVSPHNVLLDYEGAVKLSDFGLAKALSASGKARSEVVKGKPSYMSPEQCNGEPLDPRSDLFAVGVMLWEMLTHQPLFTGTPREVIAQVLFKEIVAPHSIHSRAPIDIEAVALCLLANDKNQRYANAEAAIDVLLRCEDVPRDGRRQLARLLAERFPDGALRSRAGSGTPGMPRGLLAQQIAVPVPASTLGGAGTPSLAATTPKVRWGVRAVVGSIVLAAGVAGAFAIAHRTERKRATSEDAGAYTMSDPTPVRGATAPPADAHAATVDAATAAATIALPPAASQPPPIDARVPAGVAAAIHRSVDARRGELAISVKPWAMIWINGRSVGQTPFRDRFPAGRYRVRLQNEDAGKDEVTTVTVSADQTTTLQRAW
jgi:serine/threonine protein kinase